MQVSFLHYRFLSCTFRSCSETLPVEYLGGRPLCMNQYYEVLSSCRIPGLKSDSVVNHAKSSPPPRHITVVHNLQVRVSRLWLSSGSGAYFVKLVSYNSEQLFLCVESVLCAGRVQQWRDSTEGRSDLRSAGENLQLLGTDQRGACGHPDHAASWLLGQGLRQPHHGWVEDRDRLKDKVLKSTGLR